MSKVLKKVVIVKSDLDFYAKHLELINPILPVKLTPKEIEVLGAFMSLKGEMAEEERFGTYCRKKVKKLLDLSDGGLGNYLRDLKLKKYVTDSWGIVPFLFPKDNPQEYNFILKKDESK